MKKAGFLLLFSLVFSLSALVSQSNMSSSGAEISFTFNRQRGFSSNQFAIWIEDIQGNLVKTLYAAKFTATGGWERRAQSIPLWVQKSGVSALNKRDIDAITGATPRTGTLNYSWDGLDKNGNPAAAGEYHIFLEATLREDNRVLYSAVFTLGSGVAGAVNAEVKSVYFGTSTKECGMIDNVRIVYRQ